MSTDDPVLAAAREKLRARQESLSVVGPGTAPELDLLVLDLQEALERCALAGLLPWQTIAHVLDYADERVRWLTRVDLIERTRIQALVINRIRARQDEEVAS